MRGTGSRGYRGGGGYMGRGVRGTGKGIEVWIEGYSGSWEEGQRGGGEERGEVQGRRGK